MIRFALLAALLAPSALAGSRLLQNDGFTGEGQVGFQGGFVDGECWGVVYVPQPGDYPFEVDYVETLVGGSQDKALFVIEVYQLDGTDMESAQMLDSEGVALTGSQDAFNQISMADVFPHGLESVSSGNVGIAICLSAHDGYPAIARDTDGMAQRDRNWIYASIGGGGYRWFESADLGLSGDWIQRLCITGSNIAGNGCEGDADADADADTDTDADGDADVDTGHGAIWIDSITPTEAQVGEPVDLIILGGGFGEGMDARIGGLDISGLELIGENTIQGRSPSALPIGTHDVEVELDGESDVLEGAFTVGEGGCTGCDGAGGAGGLALAPLLWVAARMRRRRG